MEEDFNRLVELNEHLIKSQSEEKRLKTIKELDEEYEIE